MEEFRVGDEVVSRPEDRPEAANTVRKVTRLLTRSGRVLDLWVAGRVVTTTHEHPFWVVGRGWVTANALRVGDEFLTSDGRAVTLERVVDDERYVSVYNLEVEADHTYFVGDAGWGFDLWSHNHNEGYRVMNPEEMAAAVKGKWTDSSLVKGDISEMGNKWLWTTRKAARKWQKHLASHNESDLAIAKVPTTHDISKYPQFSHPPQGTAVHVPIGDLGVAIPLP